LVEVLANSLAAGVVLVFGLGAGVDATTAGAGAVVSFGACDAPPPTKGEDAALEERERDELLELDELDDEREELEDDSGLSKVISGVLTGTFDLISLVRCFFSRLAATFGSAFGSE
jgi:hypothetical protein